MRPIRFGLIAAIMVALATPGAALAQAKGKAKDDKPAVSEAQRKKGMADAPAIVQAAGLTCQVEDARLIGSVPADKKTNTPAKDFYEVACQGDAGYVFGMVKGGGAAPDVNACIETSGSTTCILPGNANANAALAPALQKAGVTCAVDKVRGIGQTTTESFIEVLCQGGTGYIVAAAKPGDLSKPIKANNCLGYDAAAGNLKCTLAEPAARLAVVDRLATDAKVACTVKDRRYIGIFKDGGEGYEAACTDGKGYVLKVAANRAVNATECVKSPGLCELTDSRQALNEQAALYTRLAKSAGSNCDVDKYALFPATPGREVLELTCKDGSAAVGIFPASGKGEVLSCDRAMIAGFRCGAGKTKYDSITADLKKLGKPDCVVSDVALRGKTAAGVTQVEVACSDGLPGYVMMYATPVSATEAIGCRLTACGLPSNRPKS